jgi:hypothetical protein
MFKVIFTAVLFLAASVAFAVPGVSTQGYVSQTDKDITYTSTTLLEPITGFQIGGVVSTTVSPTFPSDKFGIRFNTYLGNFYSNTSWDIISPNKPAENYDASFYFGYAWYSLFPHVDLNLDAGYYTYWNKGAPFSDTKNTTLNASTTIRWNF